MIAHTSIWRDVCFILITRKFPHPFQRMLTELNGEIYMNIEAVSRFHFHDFLYLLDQGSMLEKRGKDFFFK